MEGTLKPAVNFDSEKDAEKLRKAMKGLGKKLITIYTFILASISDRNFDICIKFLSKLVIFQPDM